MWRSEDNFVKSLISFSLYAGFMDQTQLIKIMYNQLFLLSYVTGAFAVVFWDRLSLGNHSKPGNHCIKWTSLRPVVNPLLPLPPKCWDLQTQTNIDSNSFFFSVAQANSISTKILLTQYSKYWDYRNEPIKHVAIKLFSSSSQEKDQQRYVVGTWARYNDTHENVRTKPIIFYIN